MKKYITGSPKNDGQGEFYCLAFHFISLDKFHTTSKDHSELNLVYNITNSIHRMRYRTGGTSNHYETQIIVNPIGEGGHNVPALFSDGYYRGDLEGAGTLQCIVPPALKLH